MPGEGDLVAGVMRLANLLNRRLAAALEKTDVTPQQWLVLSALSVERTPITLVALARRLGVTKQNMTGMSARLEQLGLIERHEDPEDLRSSGIALTRRGRNLVEKVRPLYHAWLRDLGGGVSASEVERLASLVDEVVLKLDA